MGRSEIYKYLFFFIVAVYATVFPQFGFENWDSGFVTAFSWRVLNGELPYTDFIYIRPPLSAFMHAAYIYVLPEAGQYFFIRMISYIMFAAQVYFAVAGIDRLYDLKKIGVQKWGLMILCFMVSRHNFLPGPWFTTDGIFFAAAAFYVMSGVKRQGYGAIVGAACLCMASALTKQSFYFVPIIFFLWVFIGFGLKKSIAFVTTLLLLILVLVIWLTSFTSLETVIGQVAGTGSGSDLFLVGFMVYVQAYHNKYILGSILLLPLLLIKFRGGKISLQQYLLFLSWTIFASALIYVWMDFKQSTVILLNAIAVTFLYRCRLSLFAWKHYFPLVVLVVISWCSALSLGYPYPVLFASGLILSGVVLLAGKEVLLRKSLLPGMIAIAVSVWALLLNYTPYREQNITELNHSLEPVSPKLKFISSSKVTLEKNLELKKYAATLGDNYAVIPSSPIAYYLFDHQNPLPADWMTNFEIKNQSDEMLQIIADKKISILIERSFVEGEILLENPVQSRQEAFSSVALYIFEHCKPAVAGKHFLVYGPSELANTAY